MAAYLSEAYYCLKVNAVLQLTHVVNDLLFCLHMSTKRLPSVGIPSPSAGCGESAYTVP